MSSVGLPMSAMTLATVKVLPEPVIPSSVWKRSPRRNPSMSWRIASGWSPVGENSETRRNGLVVGATVAMLLGQEYPMDWRSKLRGFYAVIDREDANLADALLSSANVLQVRMKGAARGDLLR